MRKFIDIVTEGVADLTELPRYDHNAEAVPPTQSPSQRHAQAMEFYREHGYSQINAALRGHEPEWEGYPEDEMMSDYGYHFTPEDAMAHLDELMNHAPKRIETLSLFRGEKNSDHANRLAAMEIGESFVDHGYLSTSTRPSYGFYAFSQFYGETGKGNNVVSMYLVPPSVNAMSSDIDGEEKSPEKEVIIDRDSTYTLVAKKMIPNNNPNHSVKEVQLLIWRVS